MTLKVDHCFVGFLFFNSKLHLTLVRIFHCNGDNITVCWCGLLE